MTSLLPRRDVVGDSTETLLSASPADLLSGELWVLLSVMRLGGTADGIVPKTVHKTLPGPLFFTLY